MFQTHHGEPVASVFTFRTKWCILTSKMLNDMHLAIFLKVAQSCCFICRIVKNCHYFTLFFFKYHKSVFEFTKQLILIFFWFKLQNICIKGKSNIEKKLHLHFFYWFSVERKINQTKVDSPNQPKTNEDNGKKKKQGLGAMWKRLSFRRNLDNVSKKTIEEATEKRSTAPSASEASISPVAAHTSSHSIVSIFVFTGNFIAPI